MMNKSFDKQEIYELAILEGKPFFKEPKSTSSLAQPDFDTFLGYSKQFFSEKHYTNNGPMVRLLESRLAQFHNAKFCIAFCSGFWALVLAMSALAMKGKSEIIMPSLTYRRMADIAAWVGLKPRFCEVSPDTLAVSSESVRQCINSETALIMAVHPIVNCCDVEGIERLGKERGIPVLFDSVESMYESVSAGKVGKFGDAECFSMHASKLLNGFEGGYITTNNESLASQLSLMRTYGFEGQDSCVLPGGLNAKLNEMHASMGLANLDALEQLVDDNRLRYKRYQVALESVPDIRLLTFDESLKTSYKNIVVEIGADWILKRNDIVEILNAENILARAYYSPALHQKKMRYPFVSNILEVTDSLAERFINLPCGVFVSDEDIDNIVSVLMFIHANRAGIARELIKSREKSYE